MATLQPPARILAIDDDPVTLSFLKAHLEGVEIDTASTGEDGLEKARSGAFDLILLDIVMPSMDGYEVLRRLRSDPATADLPVIMLTILTDRANMTKAFQSGVTDYLVKPIEAMELNARVRAHLDSFRARRDLLRRQKQEILQEVAQGLIHEVNNPLFVIRGLTELRCSYRDGKGDELFAKKIFRATDRIASLMSALSEFASDPSSQARVVDVNAVVRRVARLVAGTLIQRKLAVDLDLSETPLWVLADAADLADAFLRLIVDAQRAIPEGGSITLRTQSLDGAAVVQLGYATASDQRPGSSQSTAQPLALSAAKQILERNRGIVDSDGEQVGDSRVRVELPRVPCCEEPRRWMAISDP